jgi:hypothetical protein
MYKTLMFVLYFPIIVTLAKKALRIFCPTNKCDSESKEWHFLLKWMVTKKCLTQTKMWQKWCDYKRGLLYIQLHVWTISPYYVIVNLSTWASHCYALLMTIYHFFFDSVFECEYLGNGYIVVLFVLWCKCDHICGTL